ncbi:putative U-box domain-containing protein 50 [Ziziphus jujuba]|uniref:RING-type E3 ubiquitin transferase n=1 Tax=Ziziphus jujuba TaxID=326968 RepID=A0ABM3IS78_ZIZJJ|nr:putative U-box domain-containing protein 50 [Ziziphus jujuba]
MNSPRPEEKVYVALGMELQDGFKTLEWTLQKWKSHPISITILHITYNITRDFVYTPFGKLPASSLSDEKLEVLKKYEKEKINNLLSKYIAFCGKVKAEILRVEKNDKPLHKLMLDLISGYHITNLVISLTIMKSSSWRSKSAIGGSFYIHQKKPDFCEFFIICGGKQVFLRVENDERIMEDDQGLKVAKMKERVNFRSLIDKMLPESLIDSRRRSSASSNLQNQWEYCCEEIENYFQHLSSLNFDEEDCEQMMNDSVQISPMEAEMQKLAESNMSITEKLESMRKKKSEAHKEIQLKRKEADSNIERQKKAQWAICLSNRRADELDVLIKEETTKRVGLKEELDTTKDLMCEVRTDIEESKKKLNSLMELQSELSNKLEISTTEKMNVESQLEKAVATRAEMVRDIGELRRQRDVLRRRVEFCREKDAIGMAVRMSEPGCSFREYSAEEIRLATDDYSERLRLKSGGDLTHVYRGRISHCTVAIKMINSSSAFSREEFQAQVEFLSHVRHPHLIPTLGFCSDPKCIVFEYMHNGNLRDIVLHSRINSAKRSPPLLWHQRIRIAAQIFSGLSFLHLAHPKPIVHGSLDPSNILLDRNLVAKISGFGLAQSKGECHVGSDIRAFGVLLLYLLTGRNWDGLVEDMMLSDKAALVRVLDDTAGQWSLDLAQRLSGLALRCLSINQGSDSDVKVGTLMEELEEMRKEAEGLVEKAGREVVVSGGVEQREQESSDVPSVFLCPIFQEVMENPCVAADGFSYEQKAIEEWLRMGRDTSPMTNLRLKHTLLTPNHNLRSLIQDWHAKRSIVSPSAL